jgi:hypothetical protein
LVVDRALETYKLPEKVAVLATVRVFVNTLTVLRAFEVYRFPVTLTGPVNDAVFATVSVFVNTLTVLKAFEVYRLPVTRTGPVNDAVFATVSVFVNTFTVLKALDAYRLPVNTAVSAKMFATVTELLTARFDKRPTDVIFG